MTIIKPTRHNNRFRYTIGVLIIFLGVGAVLTVMFYSGVVELRHRLAGTEKEMNKLEMQNADLKNRFYHKTAASHAEETARAAGLVNERNPSYLIVEPHPMASNF